MNHLIEENNFVENFQILEEFDIVVAGYYGVHNIPLKQLASRTRWLFNKLSEIQVKQISLRDKLDKITKYKNNLPVC
jgi:hypothetical protein